jgi:hypothetical protein
MEGKMCTFDEMTDEKMKAAVLAAYPDLPAFLQQAELALYRGIWFAMLGFTNRVASGDYLERPLPPAGVPDVHLADRALGLWLAAAGDLAFEAQWSGADSELVGLEYAHR